MRRGEAGAIVTTPVTVAFDESRHQGRAGRVDDTSAVQRLAMRDDLPDAMSVDHDVDVGARRRTDAVDQPPGMDDRGVARHLLMPRQRQRKLARGAIVDGHQLEPIGRRDEHMLRVACPRNLIGQFAGQPARSGGRLPDRTHRLNVQPAVHDIGQMAAVG